MKMTKFVLKSFITLLVLSICSQSCSFFSPKERKRKEIAKMISDINNNKTVVNNSFSTELMEIMGITNCYTTNDTLVYEFTLTDSNYHTKNLTHDAMLFSLATKIKNSINREKILPKDMISDLAIAEYKIGVKYTDTDNHSASIVLDAEELKELKQNPYTVLEKLNRDSIIYTLLQNEKASMMPLLAEGSEITTIDVSINNNYEEFTFIYDCSNSDMKYISTEAMKLAVINTYQNNNDLISQSADVLKELGVNGFKFIIKNKTGFEKEEIVTWHDISSSNYITESQTTKAQLKTLIDASTADLKKECGKNGIVNAWAEESNRYLVYHYVYNGTSYSIKNMPSTPYLNNEVLKNMQKESSSEEIDAYRELGLLGVKYIYQDKGSPKQKIITVNFNDL